MDVFCGDSKSPDSLLPNHPCFFFFGFARVPPAVLRVVHFKLRCFRDLCEPPSQPLIACNLPIFFRAGSLVGLIQGLPPDLDNFPLYKQRPTSVQLHFLPATRFLEFLSDDLFFRSSRWTSPPCVYMNCGASFRFPSFPWRGDLLFFPQRRLFLPTSQLSTTPFPPYRTSLPPQILLFFPSSSIGILSFSRRLSPA